MMSYPAAYLRRSHVDPNSPGDISREAQRATVRRLAEADGHNGDLVEYDDWGVSADVAKASKRTDYARLLADIEAGKVSAVYAFDVDRLYRDPRDLIRLQDAAQRHNVRIVTTGGALPISDGDDPTAEGFAFIGAVFGRMELQKSKKRARAARDARLARGDSLGRPPYGYTYGRDDEGRVVWVRDPKQPIEPVIQAFTEAGSFHAAAVLLNERGIPSQRGTVWAGNTVGNIIRREAPNLAPPRRSGARVAPRGTHALSQLLRCHCGRTMTPKVTSHTTKYGSYGPYVSYMCGPGRYDPGHGRPYMVSEASLMPWIRAEADCLAPDGDRVDVGTSDLDRRAALLERRERLGWAVTDGLMDRDAAKAEAERIDDELSRLDDRAIVELPESINWDGPPPKVNALLRAMWEHVELDTDLRPVRAEWRVPEWRHG